MNFKNRSKKQSPNKVPILNQTMRPNFASDEKLSKNGVLLSTKCPHTHKHSDAEGSELKDLFDRSHKPSHSTLYPYVE